MSVRSFDELKKLIAKQVPEGKNRSAAMEMIEQRLDPTKALEGEDKMATVWEDQARSSPTTEVYEKSVAEIWRETGCAAKGAPYVLYWLLVCLEGVGVYSPFGTESPTALAAAFRDEEHCAGARGLLDAEKARLKAIHDCSPPPASKP